MANATDLLDLSPSERERERGLFRNYIGWKCEYKKGICHKTIRFYHVSTLLLEASLPWVVSRAVGWSAIISYIHFQTPIGVYLGI